MSAPPNLNHTGLSSGYPNPATFESSHLYQRRHVNAAYDNNNASEPHSYYAARRTSSSYSVSPPWDCPPRPSHHVEYYTSTADVYDDQVCL